MKSSLKMNLLVSLLALSGLIVACTSKSVVEREPNAALAPVNTNEAYFFDEASINSVEVTYRKYNLNNPDDLAILERSALSFLVEYKRRKESTAPDVEQYVVSRETKKPYNAFNFTDSSLKEAAEYIVKLILRLKKGENADEIKYQIAQVARAIQLKYTPPVNTKYEFFKLPVYIAKFLAHPNVSLTYKTEDPDMKFLREQLVQEKDISKMEFLNSYKFNVHLDNCKYLKPKKGYGVNPGFQIQCGDTAFKMKFGEEIYGGPFNTRIYRALGYITPHINYAHVTMIEYDRKLLLEFNARLVEYFNITFAAIPMAKANNKKFLNPFNYIKGFKMKDGSLVLIKDGQQRLVPQTIEKNLTDDMFDTNFESQISQFVFGPSSLTLKDDPVTGEQIGPWSPDDLNYRDLKEVRALMVLGAWTGNGDIRKDNLGLSLIKNEQGKKALRLIVADAGSGLGDITGLKRSDSSIDDMVWEVSSVGNGEDNRDGVYGPNAERVKLLGLANYESSKAFTKIKLTDAQWMLNKICQFSSEQIKDAFIASGLSSAEVVLAHAKLLERRNTMIEHFKMSQALNKTCYIPVNRKLNYDPAKDGLMKTAPDRGHKVISGKLFKPEVKE